MPRIVDLSHPIENGTITCPGLQAPVIGDYMSRDASREKYAAGTTFQIGKIEMIASTGTYVDAEFHRFEGGQDIAGIPLERLVDLDGIVVAPDPGSGRAIDAAAFTGLDLWGRAVIVRTGWSVHFGKPDYGTGHPFLTKDAARHLVDAGAALVGIDSLNIDDAADGERPVHTTLLAARIPIVEHLSNLDRLPTTGFRFFAAPPPVRGMGSFPARAFAILPDEPA